MHSRKLYPVSPATISPLLNVLRKRRDCWRRWLIHSQLFPLCVGKFAAVFPLRKLAAVRAEYRYTLFCSNQPITKNISYADVETFVKYFYTGITFFINIIFTNFEVSMSLPDYPRRECGLFLKLCTRMFMKFYSVRRAIFTPPHYFLFYCTLLFRVILLHTTISICIRESRKLLYTAQYNIVLYRLCIDTHQHHFLFAPTIRRQPYINYQTA